MLSSEFIVQAVSGSQELVVNPVTLAEVLVLPTRDGTVEQVLAELGNLGVLEVPFPPGAAQALARLRVTGLRMPDCCVLLSAIDSGAPWFRSMAGWSTRPYSSTSACTSSSSGRGVLRADERAACG